MPSHETRIEETGAGIVSLEVGSAPSPRKALSLLDGLPGRVLLESADSSGRHSILAADPLAVLRATPEDSEVRWGSHEQAERFPDPWTAMESVLTRFTAPAPPAPTPYAGGMVGYLGFEAADWLERFPPPPPDDLRMPTVWLGLYDRALVWDHSDGDRCRAVGTLLKGRTERELRDGIRSLVARVGESSKHEGPTTRSAATRAAARGLGGRAVTSSLDQAGFMEGVERIRRRIRAGDLFQANLTRQVEAATDLSGTELYDRIVRVSPAAYAAYLDTGEGEVISISPELFLSARKGRVVTRPIKGTARRDETPEQDRELAAALLQSEKDRAENVMIVDLLRNDLSRVCQTGSVRVPELAALETHPTVHHLVSTVEGQLNQAVGPVDLLRATFPGGSVTGAPKIRAIEVLREIEPVARGPYTGAIGIVGLHGDMDLSVAIRTAVLRDGYARYGTGGGITLASEPSSEWEESEVKAGAFLSALGLR